MAITTIAVLLIGLAYTDAQASSVSNVVGGAFACPHEFGFYPHEFACDKYWSCEANVGTLKVCGNGLSFDDTDREFLKENCDYMQNIDCTGRPEREPAIPTASCDYQYGIFPDKIDCQVFWSCWDGESSKYTCGPGLAYDTKSRICTWMSDIPRCEAQQKLLQDGFSCPASGSLTAKGSFTRHAHPDDCRQYYVCFDEVPREYGCPIGTVFQIAAQEGTGQCAEPRVVPGCEDYYGELDLKSQLLQGIQGTQGNRFPSASSTAGDAYTRNRARVKTPQVQQTEEIPATSLV